jgi:hypothetical protein
VIGGRSHQSDRAFLGGLGGGGGGGGGGPTMLGVENSIEMRPNQIPSKAF